MQHLETYLTTWEQAHNFTGTVLITRAGNVLLNEGYGYSNHAAGTLNQPDTTFPIASITKTFTAIAILKLQEQGYLKISDPLSLYIPNYPHGDDICLHHLLSMTSGITNYPVTHEERKKPITSARFVDIITQQVLIHTPGTTFHYSNSNYVLLAHIIEQVTQTGYAAYLQKYIFEPLNMQSTYIDDGSYRPHQAIGYTVRRDQILPSSTYDISWNFGGGNIWSTTHDLYLFDSALHSGMLLSSDSWQLMKTPVIKTGWWDFWPQKGSSYGYGLVISPGEHNREPTMGHAGGTGSFSSYLFHFLSSDISCIVLSNYDNFDTFAQEFFIDLEAIIFGHSYYRSE